MYLFISPLKCLNPNQNKSRLYLPSLYTQNEKFNFVVSLSWCAVIWRKKEKDNSRESKTIGKKKAKQSLKEIANATAYDMG